MNPNKGGVQRVSDTLANYFKTKGHQLYYLTFEYEKEDKYQFPAELIQLPDSDFYSEVNVRFYHKLLDDLSIDIMINHDAANDRSRLFLNTGRSSVKKISLYHTDPLHELNRKPNLGGRINNELLRNLVVNNLSGLIQKLRIGKKKKQIKDLLRNSDRLIVLSKQHKQRIETVLNIKTPKIVALSNPIAILNVEGEILKKKQILFVARMELVVKRPDKMLKIWSRINDKHPDWELIFLGDGPEKDKMIELASSLNISNVRFEGFVLPAPYYQEASVLCMTSEYEGFPSVLVEAMEKEMAPVTFNNWISLKDVIDDGKNGLLASRDNLDQFAEKLDKLLSEDSYRNEIALNAKVSVAKFKVENIGPLWEQLFKELVN